MLKMFKQFLFMLIVKTACCQENVLDVAKKLGANQLVKLLQDAELSSVLKGKGPFTLFAPTDKGFSALPADVLDKLSKDKTLLKQVLSYHAASGVKLSSDLKNDQLLETLDNSQKIRINVYDGKVFATGSQVILPDTNASNGVVHMLNKVIYPVPTENVVALASKTPELSTLVYAVIRGKLQKTLTEGPFTVFAPNNAAFQKLPPGKLSDLLSNETALVDLLTYHVVSGTFYSSGLKDGMEVPTVEKSEVRISVNGDTVKVNDATVVQADISVTNGVIHVIDTVLMLPS
ncbi:transforming growth factor-beta-induced protein ig-h3-like [Saccostrea echinata]|uniref:transforming growth factor-beta-induced protein ig-h3-like n=1 Tax=Saccostrea echinata TaxID=191078 RepID=UPI002A825D39|nr:transforming growth factor-beta-induced protein ig-h3-like [Saccostrea echinata]